MIFDSMDTFGDGVISSAEFEIVLKKCGVEEERASRIAVQMIEEAGLEKSRCVCLKLINDVNVPDENISGTVDWDEFRVYLQRSQILRRLNFQERVFLTFEDPKSSWLATFISFAVLLLIILSVSGFIIETVPGLQEQPCEGCPPELKPKHRKMIDMFEILSIAIFSAEYIIRILAVRGVARR